MTEEEGGMTTPLFVTPAKAGVQVKTKEKVRE